MYFICAILYSAVQGDLFQTVRTIFFAISRLICQNIGMTLCFMWRTLILPTQPTAFFFIFCVMFCDIQCLRKTSPKPCVCKSSGWYYCFEPYILLSQFISYNISCNILWYYTPQNLVCSHSDIQMADNEAWLQTNKCILSIYVWHSFFYSYVIFSAITCLGSWHCETFMPVSLCTVGARTPSILSLNGIARMWLLQILWQSCDANWILGATICVVSSQSQNDRG